MMDCPVCREAMISMELDQVEIDYCLACHGIWLDAGELEILLEGIRERDAFLASLRPDSPTKERPRTCPICDKRLRKVTLGHGPKVLVDKCPRNDGLWLDAGELEALLKLGTSGDERVLRLLREMFGQPQRFSDISRDLGKS
jgi:Zn-finger nucleic acid-binding protein